MTILQYLLQSNCLGNPHSAGVRVSIVRSSFGTRLLSVGRSLQTFLMSRNVVLQGEFLFSRKPKRATRALESGE